MAITYPLSLPTNPAPASIKMKTTNIVGESRSPFTGQSQTYKHPGEYWGSEITTPAMDIATAESWICFLLSLKGKHGTFLAGDSARKAPRGSVSGSPLVNGAGQTGEEFSIDGLAASTSGVFLAGDYIQLGTGISARLYKVLQDVDSNSSGQAVLDIWPRLTLSPDDDDPIIYQNTSGLFRLESNVSEWVWEPGVFTSVMFSAVAVP